MARKTIAQLEAEIQTMTERFNEEVERNGLLLFGQITDRNDPRLTDFWARVHQYANDNDKCEEYDDFVEGIGAPPRPQRYLVNTNVYVIATSEEDAYDVVSTAMLAADSVIDFENDYAEVSN